MNHYCIAAVPLSKDLTPACVQTCFQRTQFLCQDHYWAELSGQVVAPDMVSRYNVLAGQNSIGHLVTVQRRNLKKGEPNYFWVKVVRLIHWNNSEYSIWFRYIVPVYSPLCAKQFSLILTFSPVCSCENFSLKSTPSAFLISGSTRREQDKTTAFVPAWPLIKGRPALLPLNGGPHLWARNCIYWLGAKSKLKF